MNLPLRPVEDKPSRGVADVGKLGEISDKGATFAEEWMHKRLEATSARNCWLHAPTSLTALTSSCCGSLPETGGFRKVSVALCVTLSGTGSPKGRRIKRRVVAALIPLF